MYILSIEFFCKTIVVSEQMKSKMTAAVEGFLFVCGLEQSGLDVLFAGLLLVTRCLLLALFWISRETTIGRIHQC